MSWATRSCVSSRSWVMKHETLTTWLWILIAPTLILWIAGAEWWSPPYTPDSEFYYSLGIFGSEVTDRALQPAYYWTRLGWILPVHLLVNVFGVSLGFAIWHWVLTTLAVAPTFFLVRRVSGVLAAGSASLIMASSTVFIVTTGNTYVISLVLPLMVAVSAASVMLGMEEQRGHSVALAIICGVAVGWIAMTNTIAAVYATLVILSAAAVAITICRRWREVRHWLLMALTTIVAAASTVAVFLGWGSIVFPGLDWFSTVLYWSRILDPSLYRDNSFAWINPGVVLLSLPLVIGAGVAMLAWRKTRLQPRERGAIAALTVAAVATMLLALAQEFHLNTVALQVPTYYPILWGPLLALMALLIGVVATGIFRRGLFTGLISAAALLAVSALVGRTGSPIKSVLGWGLALCAAGVIAWVVARRMSMGRKRRSAVVATCALAAPLALLQLFPNGGPSPGLYSSAYNKTPQAVLYSIDRSIVSWVLAETTPRDTLMVWAHPGQANMSAAAMNLWGFNAVGPLQERLTEADGGVLRANGVTILAAYAHTRAAIEQSVAGLGESVRPESTKCHKAKDEFHVVHVCVVRLSY